MNAGIAFGKKSFREVTADYRHRYHSLLSLLPLPNSYLFLTLIP